ncbi:hypothetical protein [Mixta intestinalis]|uniref:Ribosome association toxin RatA n=1 Tax=Mixta intestinalis TaxID=1615494 RepID=A0A6P1Q7Q0_9GAMM|nr:hypothetical protein [Mixta intestinalis]QHM73998.1 hypothetical protein C7M51_04359 [Mixta intestinalis]
MERNFDLNLAKKDITNLFFELGLIQSVTDNINPSDSLRKKYDLDSQELMTLLDLVSSLAINHSPLQEEEVITVDDLIRFLAVNRDDWLFNDVPYIMQGSVLLNKDVETVYSYIKDYRNWPGIINHVIKIDSEYDDGRLQTFSMYIDEFGSGKEYHVKSMRYLNSQAGIIDFAQPLPPEGFRCHKGGWRFISGNDNQTRLVSYHGFSLNKGVDPEGPLAMIRKHMNVALSTWARHSSGDTSE